MTAFVDLVRWGGRGAWPLGAARLGIVMVALGLLAGLPGALWLVLSTPTPDLGPLPSRYDPLSPGDVFGVAVFSPLVETALLVGLHRLMRGWLGLGATTFAWTSAAVFALAHMGMYAVPAAQLVGFLLMSYQYIIFRERFRSLRAYLAVSLTHGINNGLGLALMALG